jgi:hypothetical protein
LPIGKPREAKFLKFTQLLEEGEEEKKKRTLTTGEKSLQTK